MRILMALALSCGVYAGGLYAGDEPPSVKFDFNLAQAPGETVNFNITPVVGEFCRCTPALGAKADCDTSVYHLEHMHASQIIERVKSLVTELTAYAADDDVAKLPKWLVLLPTSSDDSIIAICPKAQAGLVKDAIKSCDSQKQYAVKVQLFEVGDNGKTIPVGGPHLLIGRSGNLQCSTDGEVVSLDFKADLLPPATGEVFADPDQAKAAEAAGSEACDAGRCRLDCPPPIGEMSVESESDASGIVHFSESNACDTESCGQGATCPACKNGTCTGDCCKAGCCHGQACSKAAGCKCDGTSCTSGQCTSTSTRGSQAATCSKAGVCTGTCDGACGCGPQCAAAKCCESGCCHGNCGVTSCECNGKCGAAHEKSPEVTGYEETTTEAAPCHCQKHFSIGFGFGPALHLVGPIVWFNKGNEPRCAACENPSETADSDDGHDCDACNSVPPPPAPVELDCADLPCHATHEQMERILYERLGVAPGNHPAVEVVYDGPANPTAQEIEKLLEKGGCKQAFTTDAEGSCILRIKVQAAATCGPSCTDGCPILASGIDETTPSPAARCSCEEAEDAPAAPAAEPPALLTLSHHKDPSASLPSAPRWQEELAKAFRGRRLSELFEPQPGQTTADHELGRLLAEFPKHIAGSSAGHAVAHNLLIVDMPDRVRIFETDAQCGSAKLSETVKPTNACPNCREQFRVFLEEMFRRPDDSEEISQTSHHDGDHQDSETARDLPNVTHSKIATVTVSYPLRDLVLCDDAGRPVFDTCTIIDHLQATIAPETWSHPSVSIQLDQQSVSLVVTQTAEVHQKIADHLRYLRRLQVKQICNLIERLSTDGETEPSAQNEPLTPTAEVDLGPALPIGAK